MNLSSATKDTFSRSVATNFSMGSELLAGLLNSSACAALNSSIASTFSTLLITRKAFGSGVGTHAHMVFLVIRRRNTIHRCRRTKLFVFTHNTGCCVLRNHKIQNGALGLSLKIMEGRADHLTTDRFYAPKYLLTHSWQWLNNQVTSQAAVHENCLHSQLNLHRGKHVRIIRNRIYFTHKNIKHMIKCANGGTMYLRYTSKRIRILNLFAYRSCNAATR